MVTAAMKLKDTPWKESYDQPRQHIQKQGITLSTNVHLVKSMVFPVVMYGCESWTIKKAECRRLDAFELWCWRRLLRVPWTASRSNQSILKESSPGCSLEGLMLKLKLQYFGHLMWSSDSLEKTLMLGKIEGRRRRGWQLMRWLNGIADQWTWVWLDSGSWWWRKGGLSCCGSWGRKEWDMTEQLNWKITLCCEDNQLMDVSGGTAALNGGSLEEMEEREIWRQLLDIF